MEESKINEILINILKVSKEDTDKNLSMYDVAEWDSIAHMNLIVELENNMSFELTGDEIAEMTNFKNIKKIILSKKL